MSDTEMGKPDNENPEWTAKDFSKAEPASKVIGTEAGSALVKKRGRPTKPSGSGKEAISIRLDTKLVKELRASGPGWQTRAEHILKRGVERGRHKAKKDNNA